MKPCILQ